jgi:hypothetical protein
MGSETVEQRGTILIRRTRLAPGDATPWHKDPFPRVSVILAGDALLIEYRDGSVPQRVEVSSGQVDWEEPNERVHRAVNVGVASYEEVTVVMLDRPDAVAQPEDE